MDILSNSKWIWADTDFNQKDMLVYIRKEIKPDFRPENIKIDISASNRYKLYLNGREIGIGPCPGDPKLYYYDTYELSLDRDFELNEDSGICFSAICYNLGESTEVVTGQNKGVPGFICSITISGKDSNGIFESMDILSDESFKAVPAPVKPGDFVRLDESRISKWGGYREVCDSRKEPSGWKLPGFDDFSWPDALVSKAAHNQHEKLNPREIPFMSDYDVFPESVLQTENYLGKIDGVENILTENIKIENILTENIQSGNISAAKPVIIDASTPGSFPAIVLDFGKEVVGYPSYTLKGMSGANVSFWYGESLDLYRYDTVILNGDLQTYKPYHLRAFRYLKIVFNNSETPIELHKVSVRMFHYPYDYYAAAFSSNDELLNRIWETSKYTVQMNSLEHFVDCPLREQAQWLADARVMSLANHWVFGAPDIVRKSIRQFLAVQDKDGLIPATGPMDSPLTNLDFPCHFIMLAYEYYYYTGDKDFLSEVYEKLGKIISYFESLIDNDGFIVDKNMKGFFLDWAFIDKNGQVTAAQCLFYQSLISFTKITKVLGRDSESEIYENKALILKNKINSLMFNKEKGLYCDCRIDGNFSQHYSQQSTAYALITGVAQGMDIGEEKLIENIFAIKDIEQIKGAFLLSFVTAMLFKYGYSQKSVDIIRDYWGEMLKRGATTWWETFDRSSPSTTIPYCFAGNSPTYLIDYIPSSHCHAWGSGPAYTLLQYVLGVEPMDIGFGKIRLAPVKTDLNWCEGKIPTKYGIIHIKWVRNSKGVLEYKILKVPQEIQVL